MSESKDGTPRTESLSARFWSKVDKRGPEECWLWMAARARNGYGRVGVAQAVRLAHRVAYALLIGPIPVGLTLDHFRMNPGPRNAPCSRACVNPAHLEPVTQGENVLRGNGLFAREARQTQCRRGHPFDEKNTYVRKNGMRNCRECSRLDACLRRSFVRAQGAAA